MTALRSFEVAYPGGAARQRRSANGCFDGILPIFAADRLIWVDRTISVSTVIDIAADHDREDG